MSPDADLIPHGGCQSQHGHLPPRRGGVHAYREVEALRIARFNQKALCRFWVTGNIGKLRVKAIESVGENPVFHRAPAAIDRGEQYGAVQRKLHSLAHAGIVQGRDGLIQGDVGQPDARHAVQPVLIDIPMEEEFRGIAHLVQVKHVDFSIFKHPADCLGIGDEAQVESFAAGRALPAIRVRGQQHPLFRNPLPEDEGARSDRPGRVCAEAVSGLLRRLLIQNGRARHRQAGQKCLKGIGQGDVKAQVVQNIETLQRFRPAALQGVRA